MHVLSNYIPNSPKLKPPKYSSVVRWINEIMYSNELQLHLTPKMLKEVKTCVIPFT